MAIAIAVASAFYFTGVYLLVSLLHGTPEMVQDEADEFRRVPQTR